MYNRIHHLYIPPMLSPRYLWMFNWIFKSMLMSGEMLSYHKRADHFLKEYYDHHSENSICFSYRFISRLANEAKMIAKSIALKDMDYQNAIVATWFRYAGMNDISDHREGAMKSLLENFFSTVNYPVKEQAVVFKALQTAMEIKDAGSRVEQVVCDALGSQLAVQEFVENIILLKEELNRITGVNKTELYYSNYFLNYFIKTRYYTAYAIEKYTALRKSNFLLLEKRVRKLEEKEHDGKNNETNGNLLLTNKETEDFFKIAFRNYNHLVSVADSKASLLIHVNSIIISVMLAFVVNRVEKNMFLLWPAVLILAVSMTTVLLSVLASRPQKNSFVEKDSLQGYKSFFFGSFDMIDPGFRHAGWEEYSRQLGEIFNASKDKVYTELYKETFNVRKVLARKFDYLSKAYLVFIAGLIVSIIAFLIAIGIR